MKVIIDNTIQQLIDIQEGKNWIGENFNKKLSLITDDNAFIRPLPNLHSAAEIISHLTAWRKEAILKIESGKGQMTDESEENWLQNHTLKKTGWEPILSEYRETLSKMIALLQTKDDDFLSEKYYDTDFKGYFEYRFVIRGMLHHDIYHLGQLGIIIKLLK